LLTGDLWWEGRQGQWEAKVQTQVVGGGSRLEEVMLRSRAKWAVLKEVGGSEGEVSTRPLSSMRG
jgi:Na+-transporting NADH:ubiquinone oxidoreductase subunit NqrB